MNDVMKPHALTFIGNDPGAVQYGNFINYYSFHSAKLRTDNLHSQMFSKDASDEDEPILCLDVGCNSGELSKEIHTYMKANIYPNRDIRILAMDIDPALIERAHESDDNGHITFVAANIMDENGCEIIKNYLDSYQKTTFDVTFCFSVTMWIHINNGDEGLKELLKFIKGISKTIIIEPQPWHCYRNAQRRMTKSGGNFPLYKSLKIRSNVEHVIINILSEDTHVQAYASPSSPWHRRIISFQNNVRNSVPSK